MRIVSKAFFILTAALRRVIASARSEDVPKSTIENAIKRATTVSDQQEFTFEVLGPGIFKPNVFVSIHCHLTSLLPSIIKFADLVH